MAGAGTRRGRVGDGGAVLRPRSPASAAAAVALALGLAASACLPARLGQDELDQRVRSADTASDASGDGGVPKGCGNGSVDGDEQCDFAGANWCSGCEQCQRRMTWKVDGDSAMVTPVNPTQMATLLTGAGSGFSVELWFKAAQLPSGDANAGMVAVAGKLPGSPAFIVALVRDPAKNASYVTCGYVPKQNDVSTGLFLQGSDAIKVGQWHHLRCAWSASDMAMKLSLDGETPATLNVSSKPSPLFDPVSSFALGSLSLASGKAGFVGELDEFRMLVGAGAGNFKTFQPRYSGDGQGAALLLHMDEAAGSTRLLDSGANKLHLRQTSKQGLTNEYEKVPLLFQTESCYGYSQAQLKCAPAAQPKAPFCS